MGSSPFARHYSGSRGFFPFLWVLRCFSSPACLLVPYVFRHGYARITTRGFPHSDIPGSTDGQLLPRAFRSRPRPSSALGAKASTVCSCSLDQKEHVCCRYGVFKVRASVRPPCREEPSAGRLAGMARSLKTQQRARSPRLRATGRTARELLASEHYDELDIVLGEPTARTKSRRTTSTRPAPTGVRAPVSLERR